MHGKREERGGRHGHGGRSGSDPGWGEPAAVKPGSPVVPAEGLPPHAARGPPGRGVAAGAEAPVRGGAAVRAEEPRREEGLLGLPRGKPREQEDVPRRPPGRGAGSQLLLLPRLRDEPPGDVQARRVRPRLDPEAARRRPDAPGRVPARLQQRLARLRGAPQGEAPARRRGARGPSAARRAPVRRGGLAPRGAIRALSRVPRRGGPPAARASRLRGCRPIRRRRERGGETARPPRPGVPRRREERGIRGGAAHAPAALPARGGALCRAGGARDTSASRGSSSSVRPRSSTSGRTKWGASRRAPSPSWRAGVARALRRTRTRRS